MWVVGGSGAIRLPIFSPFGLRGTRSETVLLPVDLAAAGVPSVAVAWLSRRYSPVGP